MRSMSRPLVLCLIVILTLGTFTSRASSADDPLEKRVTLAFENTPIRTVLEQVFSLIGLKDFVIDPGVQGSVTIKLTDTPLKDLVFAVFKHADLTASKEGGTYLVRPRSRPGSNGRIRVGLSSSIGTPDSLIIRSDRFFEITDWECRSIRTEVKTASFRATDGAIEVEVGDDAPRSFKGPLRLVHVIHSLAFEIVSPKARYARYRGILEISPGPRLTVVNELPLEDYVRGVIPTEVSSSFHPEAQKALTVAIRTYALKSLDRHKWQGYNLCDGIHCQGFAGAAKESAWADKLADETRGRIIVYKNEPIYAVYSSDCGGMTRNNEDAGFGSRPWPYLRSVADSPQPAASPSMDSGRAASPSMDSGRASQQPAASNPPSPRLRRTSPRSVDYCAGGPYHTWSKTFTTDELARVFARLPSVKIGKLESVEFAEYDCSGRVRIVVIKGDQGEHRISGNRFRELLGESTIKSTRMTLSATDEGCYLIEGKGFGHGVGLCSFGANGLAKSREGITYVDILKHYYTGTEVKAIGDSRVKY